MKERSWLTD